MTQSTATAERSPTLRSKITNGSKMVHGLDGRSAAARRFRDLKISYASDLGGPDGLSEAQKALIDQTATLQVQAERVQAAILNGEQIDAEQLTRLCNSVARNLTRLGIKRKPPAPVSPLAAHFASPPAREVRG